MPRNSLRTGIGNFDIGITKNTRFANGQTFQLRLEMFNATSTAISAFQTVESPQQTF